MNPSVAAHRWPGSGGGRGGPGPRGAPPPTPGQRWCSRCRSPGTFCLAGAGAATWAPRSLCGGPASPRPRGGPCRAAAAGRGGRQRPQTPWLPPPSSAAPASQGSLPADASQPPRHARSLDVHEVCEVALPDVKVVRHRRRLLRGLGHALDRGLGRPAQRWAGHEESASPGDCWESASVAAAAGRGRGRPTISSPKSP